MNRHKLRHRGVAFARHAVDWNQRVGLREIRGSATAWDAVRHDHEMIRLPLLTVKMTGQIDNLALGKSEFRNVLCVQEDHAGAHYRCPGNDHRGRKSSC